MPEADPQGALKALNELFLEIDGNRYEASEPEWGDGTLEEDNRPGSADVFTLPEQRGHVTIGISKSEIGGLHAPIPRAVLRDRDGNALLELMIEKVDPELGVVVGRPIPR